MSSFGRMVVVGRWKRRGSEVSARHSVQVRQRRRTESVDHLVRLCCKKKEAKCDGTASTSSLGEKSPWSARGSIQV